MGVPVKRKLSSGISVVIPSIPPREKMLARAVASVKAQTLPATAVVVEVDHTGTGAPATRDRALRRVWTEWTAFLDDDDEFLPHHLSRCMEVAEEQQADLVFPWFKVIGGRDPFTSAPWYLQPYQPGERRVVPITTLVRTEALRTVGGFGWYEDRRGDDISHGAGEDQLLVRRISDAGFRVVHVPEVTWLYHHDSQNTSGRANRWLGPHRHRQRKMRRQG